MLAGANEVDAVLPQAINNNDIDRLEKIEESGKTCRLVLKSALQVATANSVDNNDNQMLDILRSAMDRFYPVVVVETGIWKSSVGTY